MPSAGTLTPTIGFGQAVALYVGAVLGAGVLVLPGQAASLGGPASLVAWAFVGLLGLPVALTFAALAVRHPDAGGVATYATEAFGPSVGGIAGWLYFAAGSVGQTIVPLTGGYYVAAIFDAGPSTAIAVGGCVLSVAVGANIVGLRLSGRLQLGLAAGVGVVLLTATLVALPRVDGANFVPFAPHGLGGVGEAALVLFFAFAGWEAVAHLAGEFRNVKRDLRRATVVTVGIVSVLYLGVSSAVVGTGNYGSAEADRVAVGTVLAEGLGGSAVTAAGVVAVVVSLGTTNAFVASVSRLGYALARDGWLPRPLGRLNGRGVPVACVAAVGLIGAGGLLVALVWGLGTEELVVLPSSLVLATYLIGMAAGIRLLAGPERVLACAGFALCAVVAPFASAHVLVPTLVAAGALAYRFLRSRLVRGH